MEPEVLSRARRQLAGRLAAFTSGLICIFALQTHNQVRENTRTEHERHLRLMASIASRRFSESKRFTQAPGHTIPAPGGAADVSDDSRDGTIRILWIDPSMTIVDEFGSFVPGGSLVPPAHQRLKPQSLVLSNGVGFWQPVSWPAGRKDPQSILGFVAIGSSEDPGNQGVLISLISATAASVGLALLGIPWILERSLLPLREQISRLRHFAGDIAHELRNPMMALKTNLANAKQLLGSDLRDPMQCSLMSLDVIASRMALTLDDIQLIAELENQVAGQYGAAINVDIEDIFDELSVLHDSESRASQVELLFIVQEPFRITVVPSRIQRILSNLIANAMRFSVAGSTVRVSAFLQQEWAVISVDDEGPGIPKAEQTRVFERFVQLNSDHVRGHAGIGLALSRSLAKLHGGVLDVQDSPQGGCRMLLQLPRQPRRRRWRLPWVEVPG